MPDIMQRPAFNQGIFMLLQCTDSLHTDHRRFVWRECEESQREYTVSYCCCTFCYVFAVGSKESQQSSTFLRSTRNYCCHLSLILNSKWWPGSQFSHAYTEACTCNHIRWAAGSAATQPFKKRHLVGQSRFCLFLLILTIPCVCVWVFFFPRPL